MIHFTVTELGTLLVMVTLLFGVGRISKTAKEIGSSVRTFRTRINGEKENKYFIRVVGRLYAARQLSHIISYA